jgi:hypothetical protein
MTITNSIHSFKYAWSPFILHDVIYEIIHVGDIRNDVFVSLERGEFERGTKYAVIFLVVKLYYHRFTHGYIIMTISSEYISYTCNNRTYYI